MKNYFTESDFARCNPSCSMSDMEPSFLRVLNLVREKLAMPIVITSAYRSVVYEKSKNRSGTSSHTKGVAADLRCPSSVYRASLIRAIYDVYPGARIGVYPGFVHLDIDTSKPFCMWLGLTSSNSDNV